MTSGWRDDSEISHYRLWEVDKGGVSPKMLSIILDKRLAAIRPAMVDTYAMG